MSGVAPGRPSAGERARTLAYGIADGVLAVPGVPYAPVSAHTTDGDGRPLLLVPADSAVVAALHGAGHDGPADLAATLRICDVAPVPLPDRLRGRAWLHGWVSELPDGERRDAARRVAALHPRPELLDVGVPRPRAAPGPSWTILALEVAQVEVQDMWGQATLEPEEYAAAVPDPLVAIESGVLSHLDSCHRAELVTLLERLHATVPRVDGVAPPQRGTVVRPLALDRYGMWLRCTAPGDPVDLRVVFGEPVRDINGLRCVYRRLFAGTPHK